MKPHKSEGVAAQNTLHHALGPFLVGAQFFGVLPVAGTWPTARVADLRFRWFSPTMLATCFLIAIATNDMVLAADGVLKYGLALTTVGPMSFSTMCLVSLSVFLLLARNWPALMQQTRRCEVVFLRPCYASPASLRFSRNIRTLGSVLLLGAIAEHMTYLGSDLYRNHLQITECNLTVNFWENYFLRDRRQIYYVIKFSIWMSPVIEWITIALTFCWNFVDVLLILISRGLAVRIDQVRWRLAQHTKQRMPAAFWLELRQDFMQLVDLLRQFDARLSSLILLSCSCNLYYICVQIFYSFQKKGNIVEAIYFWCAFGFILVRILSMLFSAASINEAGSALAHVLFEVPTDDWCLELKRLSEMLVSENIAFSGSGFFMITRRLIFAMAGTIVIYELVLLSRVQEVPAATNLCETYHL